ncbi:MAG: lipocalin family protein [Alistipes sp.]|nr:lipocalin family protein [Alistipes sp.]
MRILKIFSLVALFAMALVGCEEPVTPNNPNNGGGNGGDTPVVIQTDIVGKWHLTSWCSATPEFDVYIEFAKDGNFNIYQQTWLFTYQHFTGTYQVKDNVLTGKYSDGSSWLTSYTHEVVDSKLTLKSSSNLDEVSIYEACVIPAEIIEEAHTATRSEEVVPFL